MTGVSDPRENGSQALVGCCPKLIESEARGELNPKGPFTGESGRLETDDFALDILGNGEKANAPAPEGGDAAREGAGIEIENSTYPMI